MISKFRPLIEYFPSVARFYRSMRDLAIFKLSKSKKTPLGFLFMGHRDMEDGKFEVVETRLLQDEMRKSDVLIDVGANVGYYTCIACQMGKKVLAFEPLQNNLKYAYKNLMLNQWDNIELYPIGLGAESRIAPLYGQRTGASLIKGWAGMSIKSPEMISISTLDNIVGDRFIDKKMVIKVDIEGSEFLMLKGALKLLARRLKPVWLMEICLNENFMEGKINENFFNTFDIFWRHGYQAKVISDKADHLRDVLPEDVKLWVKEGKKTFGSPNYIFYPVTA